MKAKSISWIFPAVALMAAPVLVPLSAMAETESGWGRQARPAAVTGTYLKGFARLLSGNGWETTIVLMDLGSTPITFQESFLGNKGAPASFSVNSGAKGTSLTTSTLQGTISPNGSASFTLTGNPGTLEEAWSLVTFIGAQDQLGGYATLRHTGGSAAFEVTVPLSGMQDYSVRARFDNTGGYETQLTLANPASNMAAQVQLAYLNSEGEVMLVDSVPVNPQSQLTISLPNTYPDLGNQIGTIAVLGNLNCLAVSALGYNPSSGAIAPIPVMNFSTGIALQ